MNHAALYCKTPERVTKRELLNALHQSLMQFNAIATHEALSLIDNSGVVTENKRLLARAGHIGFTR